MEEIDAITNPQAKEREEVAHARSGAREAARAVDAGEGERRVGQGPPGAARARAALLAQDRRERVRDFLLANTSLEKNSPINLVMLGLDGRPAGRNMRDAIADWVEFRFATVTRRTKHRLDQVLERIHILEGRMIVLLNIDKVIKIIRNSDDPKADLMKQFKLTEVQADDILEIRLRQLARLEGIRIEQELKSGRRSGRASRKCSAAARHWKSWSPTRSKRT